MSGSLSPHCLGPVVGGLRAAGRGGLYREIQTYQCPSPRASGQGVEMTDEEALAAYLGAANEWEQDRRAQLATSVRRAWQVAAGATIIPPTQWHSTLPPATARSLWC